MNEEYTDIYVNECVLLHKYSCIYSCIDIRLLHISLARGQVFISIYIFI
jgi:hypothetical protein